MTNNDEVLQRIAKLLRTGAAIDYRKSVANFEIGRLLADMCAAGEDGINEAAAALNSRGVFVQQSFLYDTYRVFRSIKSEATLGNIRHKLHGRLPWGFLVNHCTGVPDGDDEVVRQYWESQFNRIERGLTGAAELAGLVAEHLEQLPEDLRPQAEGVLEAFDIQGPVKPPAYVYPPVRSVLHTGDEHFDCDPNLADVVKSAGHIVELARQLRPDLIVSAGDMLNCRQSHDSPALSAAGGFVKECAEIAPMVILKGTTSHDGVSVGLFRTLKTRHKVYVAETLGMVGLKGGEFFPLDEYQPGLDALILAVPPASKATILAHGGELNGSNATVSDMLRSVFDIWGSICAQAKQDGVMTIVVGHGTVTGAVTSTGQKMVGRDIEFSLADLRGIDADVTCLAHIHRAQSWPEERVFYSGSIAKLNVGETEDKGVWLHVKTEAVNSSFLTVPTKHIVSQAFDGLPDLAALPAIQEGSLVRICYKVAEEEVHSFDEEALRAQLMAMGAGEVRIEKSVIPKQMVRAAGISKMASLAEKLGKWGETTGTEISTTMKTKLALLEMPRDVVFSELNLDIPRRRTGR
jgi:exonuclease SbcD